LTGTARVSRYQKGKTDLDFTEARDSEWQWPERYQSNLDFTEARDRVAVASAGPYASLHLAPDR